MPVARSKRSIPQNAGVANQTSYDSWRYTALTVRKSRWARLPFGVRMTIGTLALLVPCVGAVFGVTALVSDTGPGEIVERYAAAVTSDSTSTPTEGTAPTPTFGADASAGLGGAPAVPGAATPGTGVGTVGAVGATPPGVPATPGFPAVPRLPGAPTFDAEMPIGGTPVDPATEYEPVHVPAAPPAPVPLVETRTVTETEAIPFQTQYVRDSSLPRRSHEVRTPGEQGVKTLTYEVTTTDGQQTDKRLVSESVNRDPVTRVVAIGPARRDCDGGGGGGGGHGDDDGDDDTGSDGDSEGGSDGDRHGDGPRRCNGNPGS